ncbi:hypothetical protein QN277_004028 [Acacia crassicarpa]|uniref:Uncharacterized protein n=1 Tax=Acacia crassicarpa TaxID=499986 RepID=A0AAE1J1M0_9FABA|nr:hypothetical protein QN277_004028 [Acacia crassicarpa]
MMLALDIALLCVNSSRDERPTMKDVAAMLKEVKQEREEYAKVDALLKGSPPANNDVKAAAAATSSLLPALKNLYREGDNNTIFSVSSLLHSSSSSSAKVGLK